MTRYITDAEQLVSSESGSEESLQDINADDERENQSQNTNDTEIIAQKHRNSYFKYGIIALAIVAVTVVIIYLNQKEKQQQPPQQSHHAFFYLKTEGYTELEGITDLHWFKDESQDVGNFHLVNETYIYVPQNGIYQIGCAVQLYIPEDTPSKCPPPPPLQPVATTSPLPTTPTSPPFHHSLLHLKTKGYEELESLTNLQWIKVMNQSKGDIKLLGGTFIYIPEDGIYLIECTIQLNIPKNTITFHMFLTLEGKNGTQYEYIKETLNSLTFSEHTRIQLISTKYLEVNDKIYFRMNKVKFISPDKSSSRCSITNIH
ncbi:uncharacterized protein LOC106872472 [Octopus bimaculoides]|uniref:uncharacterized protein LOC106872472 n=1 Tax=Octopus bimaculoides TaxID=37653 RepID=UPI0022E207CE|nr:uncharacterized protein LOC106872472 [Octopus bimaculoides]